MTVEMISDRRLSVTVRDRANMEGQLDEAVNLAQQSAVEDGLGILVTRHDAHRFTVELSDSVPFGLIQELQAW